MKNRPLSKKISLILLGLIAGLLIGCGTPLESPTPEITSAIPTEDVQTIVLKMGSWRTEDVDQMNSILDLFHAEYPHIVIEYDPTPATQYDEALTAQFEAGAAPDLFYLRSYAISRSQFEAGYLEPLDDLPGLYENFTPEMRAPWATDDGLPYGVPFIATSHGVYFNQIIFRNLGLEVPATWDEFISAAQVIQDAGIIPLANASGSQWTIAEIVFMNLAPNFIGGREGRMAYLNGERCFNDEHVVAAFQAVADLAPYLPENHELLSYGDSLQFFLQGEAAMWLGGSWDIPYFETETPDFAWSIFAPPPPVGQPAFITFHLDAGMGINAASTYKEEARLFLEWMTSQEMAAALANELPGFFPMHNNVGVLENPHANVFLSLNQGRGTDVRFAWEKLREGTPDGYTLMMEGAVGVINGEKTPQQAADELQNGLAQWFEPAKNCD